MEQGGGVEAMLAALQYSPGSVCEFRVVYCLQVNIQHDESGLWQCQAFRALTQETLNMLCYKTNQTSELLFDLKTYKLEYRANTKITLSQSKYSLTVPLTV